MVMEWHKLTQRIGILVILCCFMQVVLAAEPLPTDSLGSYQRQDFVKLIENYNGFTKPYTIYEVCNPTATDYVITDLSKFRLFFKGNLDKIKDYDIYLGKTVNETKYTYNKVCSEYQKVYPNSSIETKTNCTNVIVGSYNIVRYQWNVFNPIGKTFGAGKCYRIKIAATLKPSLELNRAIDNVINYNNVNFTEYAWWNTSCPVRETFQIQPTYSDTNQQILLNLTSPSDMTKMYVILNASNVELAFFNITQNAIWTNTSVTGGTNFGIDVYYNCSASVKPYNISAVMLGAVEFESDTEVDAFEAGSADGGTIGLNTTFYHRGIGGGITTDLGNQERSTYQAGQMAPNTTVIMYYSLHSVCGSSGDATIQIGASNHQIGCGAANWQMYNTALGGFTDTGIAIVPNDWVQIKFKLNTTENAYINEQRVYTTTLQANYGKWGTYEGGHTYENIDTWFIYRDYDTYNPTVTSLGLETPTVASFITTPLIQPSPFYYNDTFNCSVKYTGNNGGYLNFTYYRNWFAFGAVAFNQVFVINGSTYNSTQSSGLDPCYGAVFICNVTGNSSGTYETKTSGNFAVYNYPPTIPQKESPSDNSIVTGVNINLSIGKSINPGYGQWGGSCSLQPDIYYLFKLNNTAELVNVSKNVAKYNYSFVAWANGTYTWNAISYTNATHYNNGSLSYGGIQSNYTFTVNTTELYNLFNTYNGNITYLSREYYYFNFSYYNLTVSGINATFIYNNTVAGVVHSLVTDYMASFNTSISIPISSNGSLVTSIWTIRYVNSTGGLTISNYTVTQRLNGISFHLCYNVSGLYPVLNISYYDEVNLTSLNGSTELNMIVWFDDRTNNISLDFGTVDNYKQFYICMNDVNITRYANAQFSYYQTGYDRRDYFLRNYTLSTYTPITPPELKLYMLIEGYSTGLKIIVTDDTETPLVNHIVYVQRKDISNTTFYVVAMGKTDSNGEAFVPLEYYNAWYKFLVYSEDNDLIKITEEAIVQASPLYIRITPGSISEILNNFENLGSLTFDNDSRTWTYSYSDPTGAIKEICLEVKELSLRTGNLTVCKKCLTTASGSLSCVVPNVRGSYVAIVYAAQNPFKNIVVGYWNYAQSIGKQLGLEGIFLSLLILLAVVGMFLSSPTIAVLGVMLGTIFIFLFGIGSLPYLAAASIVAAGLVIIITFKNK